jgi:hypothetical protein
MKWATTLASALFLTASVPLLAGTFDNAGVALAGSAPVARILYCVYDQGREDPEYASMDIYALD